VERAVRDDGGTIVDFEIVWMNNAPVDVARRPREELVGRRISALYPALAGGELIAGYRRVVDTGEPLVVPVLPYEDVIDGRRVSGFYTVQATKFEDGVLVASRDITPLENSRLELEAALRELETAQRLAQLGTWRINLTTQRTELSRELQRIFGLPGDAVGEAQTAALVASIHPDDLDSVEHAHERSMRTRHPEVVEHRVLRGDGTIAHVRTYTEPVVVDDAVVGLWGTTQDISDIIESRAALRSEHSRRVSAEMLAALAAELNRATNLQDVTTAVHESAKQLLRLVAVVLGVLESEPILRLYYSDTGVSDAVQARYMRTPLSMDTHMTRVVNESRPLFLKDRAAQQQAFPAIFSDTSEIAAASSAVLPLIRASGEVFGSLALACGQPLEYDATTRLILDDVAELVARTAERLELRELERSIARSLQSGLLAVDVRSTTVIVRTRYQASDASMEIGGDWYDAVVLDDGRLAVAVGDVVGRGLPAATTMGQLRSALAVTAMQAKDAADAINILDGYSRRVHGAKCTTVCIALMDPGARSVSYASAGHPPPLLVTPDGASRYLEGGRSWPLGIDTSVPRPGVAIDLLPAGSLLLLFTDGLVERRGESLDAGLARLQQVVSANWNLPLRRLKQAIFAALVDDPEVVRDDVALVAARTTGSSPSLFADAFAARPDAAHAARHRLQKWLRDTGIETGHADSLTLGIAEAVANAIDHGSRRDASQIVKVEVAIRDTDILASISDSGHWLPGIDGYFSGRGRGHVLMEALLDDVDIDTDAQGTIVTLRLSLPSRE